MRLPAMQGLYLKCLGMKCVCVGGEGVHTSRCQQEFYLVATNNCLSIKCVEEEGIEDVAVHRHGACQERFHPALVSV